jgi:DNA invertase Pin-like site-specific DNA recombinase
MMLQMLGSFAEFKRAMLRERTTRWVWKALAGKDPSAAAVRSSDHSSRRKSLRWFRGEERLPMLHAFSTGIRRLFVAS